MSIKKCPLCKKKYDNIDSLANHIESKHANDIPNNWSGAKYYFYSIHGRSTGKCRVCGKETQFNEITKRPNVLCSNPNCKKIMRDNAKNNMIKKYGKETLLNDPEFQEKMLSNRSIAKDYKWSDGSIKRVIGTYEYDAARFLDVFIGCPSVDIMIPAPMIIDYEYNGEKHFYIPDMYQASLNLIIEIKDTTSTHPKIIAVDREKEKAKEEAIKKLGKYNYVKIENKQYGIYLQTLLELKNKEDKKSDKPVIMIKENYNTAKLMADIINENTKSLLVNEKALTSKQRKNLDNSDFGIPEERKFPLTDKKHVLMAIRYFYSCEQKYRKKLANNINNKAKQFDMKINVSKSNPFYEYADKDILKNDNLNVSEASALDYNSENNDSIEDIKEICELLNSKSFDNIFISSDYHFYKEISYINKRTPNRTLDNRLRDANIKIKNIRTNHNSNIGKDDIFLFLGDLGHKALSKDYNPKIKEIVQSLNGIKILIRGNHDHLSDKEYKDMGFSYVLDKLSWNNILFTHKPVDKFKEELNVHGHVHDGGADTKEEYKLISSDDHICVCVNQRSYTPLSLNKVLSLSKDKKEKKGLYNENVDYNINSFNTDIIYHNIMMDNNIPKKFKDMIDKANTTLDIDLINYEISNLSEIDDIINKLKTMSYIKELNIIKNSLS